MCSVVQNIYSVQCPEKEHASLSVEANLDHTLLIRHTRLKAILLHQPSIEKYQEQDKGETANVSPLKSMMPALNLVSKLGNWSKFLGRQQFLGWPGT